MGSNEFSNLVNNSERRRRFLINSIIYLKAHKFDGLGKYFHYNLGVF